MSRKLVLDKTMIIQMLGDEEFYKKCPIFLFLRESAIASHSLYVRALRGEDISEICGSCSDMAIMKPQIYILVNHIRQQFEFDPDNLECIKDYLEWKTGRRPDPVVIYYKSGSKPVPIQF